MVSIVTRNRKLKNEDDVFTQNAWDDTEWTEEMLENAERRIEEQREESRVAANNNGGISVAETIDQVELRVTQKWDEFYKLHTDKFFKDRQWIFSEFPEILKILSSDYETCQGSLFEVGCGVGNAVAHIIGSNQNPNLRVYCCDLSPSAIDTLKKRSFYLNNKAKITAFQADVCKDFDEIICKQVSKSSIDFITIVFSLSAMKPENFKPVIENLVSLLKPGGMILFRDYAQYDLTQLRFKGKSYLRDNYYVRADGTTSYFFTKQFVDDLFSRAGLVKVELKNDNRMLVNRSKCLKMCRCWIQAKYMKPFIS